MNQIGEATRSGRRFLVAGAATFLGAVGAAGIAEASASSSPPCRGGAAPFYCKWVVDKVSRISGEDTHARVKCVSFAKSRLEQHITCAVAKSASDETTATLGGQAPAGISALSASVGYNVTRTTTVTTSDTVDVPPHRAGYVWWAAVYGNRRSVYQQYEKCVEGSSPKIEHGADVASVGCQRLSYSYDYATARTEQYVDPVFGASG